MNTKTSFRADAFEHLEARELLSTASAALSAASLSLNLPATPVMPNVGPILNSVYQDYVANKGNTAILAIPFPLLRFKGDSVSVVIKAKSVAAVNTLVPTLSALGTNINSTSAFKGLVSAYLPIADLPLVAALPQTASIAPNYNTPVVAVPAVVVTSPLATMSPTLNSVYQDYVADGGNTALVATQFPLLEFQGNSVSVSIKAKTLAAFNLILPELSALGMNINAVSAYNALVSGYLPIAQLPTVAALTQTLAMLPNYRPMLFY